MLPTRESRSAEEKTKDAEEKTPLAALPRMLTKVFSKAAGVFFKDAKEFCKPAKFLEQPVSNVRRDTANGMQQEKNVRMLAEEFRMHTKDGRKLTKEFSNVEKKLCTPGTSPGKPTNFLRKVGKVLRKLADVFSQDDSAAPKLGETWFRLTFFSRNMHEEKSEAVFSFRNMHEEESKDVFSVGKVHPPAILHTFSAFALKQRTSVPKQGTVVRNPAGAVDKDDTMQHSAVAGREAGTYRPAICDACILRIGRLTG